MPAQHDAAPAVEHVVGLEQAPGLVHADTDGAAFAQDHLCQTFCPLWLSHNSQARSRTILFHLQRSERGIQSAIGHESVEQRAEPFRR